MGIACKSLRETTWKRPEISRGLQSDQCYYFQPEKIARFARVRGLNDISLLPNPDLAIEVDISRPEIDRAGIYAALGVLEVWRFVDNRIMIERLTPDGNVRRRRDERLSPRPRQRRSAVGGRRGSHQ